MASIRQLPSGAWQVRYRHPTEGRYVSQSGFTSRDDAEAWALTNAADILRRDWIDPAKGAVSFGDWVEEWFATTVGLRPSSRARDASYLNTHVVPVFGDYPLAAITQPQVKAWVAELAPRRAPATVHKAYQTLAKVMAAAVDAGLIRQSPCRNMRDALPRIERDEMRFCDEHEVRRLAEAIHPRYRALVFTAAYGGLRLSELAGLTVAAVDPLRATIRVFQQAVEVRGKIHVGPPKTRAGTRTVPLHRGVMDEIVAHMASVGADPGAFLFPGRDGGALRPANFRSRFWNPAVREAGLWPLRIHDLRHTAVAFWIDDGATDLEVTRWAGHTSVAVVKDRYGHLFPERMTGTIERQGERFARAQGGEGEVRELRG